MILTARGVLDWRPRIGARQNGQLRGTRLRTTSGSSDGGEDEEDVEGSRLPLLIVIALLVLAAFGGVVWLAYQRGVAQGHAEVPRVIAAEPGPAKVAPSNAAARRRRIRASRSTSSRRPRIEEANSDTAPPPSATKPDAPAVTPPPAQTAPAQALQTAPPRRRPPTDPTRRRRRSNPQPAPQAVKPTAVTRADCHRRP